MKKSEEDNKKQGKYRRITIIIEWEIINEKITQLRLTTKDSENLKNEIKKKEAENLRQK